MRCIVTHGYFFKKNTHKNCSSPPPAVCRLLLLPLSRARGPTSCTPSPCSKCRQPPSTTAPIASLLGCLSQPRKRSAPTSCRLVKVATIAELARRRKGGGGGGQRGARSKTVLDARKNQRPLLLFGLVTCTSACRRAGRASRAGPSPAGRWSGAGTARPKR